MSAYDTFLATFLAAAHNLLGERGITTDPELMAPWLTDWRGRYRGEALAMASPGSSAELAELVKLCAEHRVPIVPQGGNSGMSGGATPDDSGTALLLSIRRMNAIRAIDPDRGEAVCEAGVVLQTLHEAAAEANMRFPLTLGGKGSATIGGLISTNAGGTQVLRHGVMRDQVLGLEAVMADGSVFDALSALKKDNRGFDIKQLLIGSEGTLGIVTAARLRLLPAVSSHLTIWCGLAGLDEARALLSRCERELGDVLEGFELIPRHSLEAVLAYLADARNPLADPHDWHALIELAAPASEHEAAGDATLPARAEVCLGAAMEDGVVRDAVIASSETQAEALWLLRESISAAERALGPAMQHDISVPVADMTEFVAAVSGEVERNFPGTSAIAYGHLGDGNVHFHVLAPAQTGGKPYSEEDAAAWEAGEGKAISRFVHDRVSEWDGSISAEHGIGQLKRDELARLSDPVRLDIMRRVKQALDPDNILNPGKLLACS